MDFGAANGELTSCRSRAHGPVRARAHPYRASGWSWRMSRAAPAAAYPGRVIDNHSQRTAHAPEHDQPAGGRQRRDAESHRPASATASPKIETRQAPDEMITMLADCRGGRERHGSAALRRRRLVKLARLPPTAARCRRTASWALDRTAESRIAGAGRRRPPSVRCWSICSTTPSSQPDGRPDRRRRARRSGRDPVWVATRGSASRGRTWRASSNGSTKWTGPAFEPWRHGAGSVHRRHVESHGGRIWASPRRGSGSTFILVIPLARLTRAGGVGTTAG